MTDNNDPLDEAAKALESGDVQERMRKALEETKLYMEPEKKPSRVVRGTCRTCGGVVVETFFDAYTRPIELIPIGPASKQYVVRLSGGLYCEECGVKYEFLPKEYRINEDDGSA